MNRLIDTHSHILYGIDDGAKSLDESITIIKKMKSIGFTDLIITPHYIEGTSYNANNKLKKELIVELRNKVREENIDINLYLGNEVFIFNNMFEGLVNGEIYTLNGSRYLLFEVPFENEINDLDDYLFRLINKGVIPVLAHPERYAFLQKDPERVVHLMNMGVLLQGNFASITKRYGRHAYKLFKYYLKKGYFTFLGSDVHHGNGSFYDNYPKMAKKITRIIGKDKFIELTFTNPMRFFQN